MINNFKKARLIADMTQRELADRLNVSAVTIHNWESGRNLPKAKRLNSIACVLNTSVANLLGDDG